MTFFVVLALAGLEIASGQSVSNCGASGDHFQNVQYSISPDPIQRGKEFTVSVSGDLDEDVTGGNLDIDITAGAFGQSVDAKETLPFKLSDGLMKAAKGQIFKLGPIKIPSLPGSAVVNGTVKLSNAKGEAIACMKLDVNAPLFEEEQQVRENRNEPQASGNVTICSKDSDHIKNLKITAGDDSSTTIAGSLDELLTTFNVNAALKLKIGPIPYTVNFGVPVSYTPGVPAGDFQIFAGAPKVLKTTLGDIISVSGEITAVDGNGEEILCLDIASTSATKPTNVVV